MIPLNGVEDVAMLTTQLLSSDEATDDDEEAFPIANFEKLET